MMLESKDDRSRVLARFFADIEPRRVLTREQERDIAASIGAGCTDSRNKLVESNLGFVAKIASEYRNLGLPFEDLLNEGSLGLIEAAQRFDGSKGTRFLTYAIWWIRKFILTAISRNSTLVRLPGEQARRVREMRQVEERLRSKLGRQPLREEISRELKHSLTRVEEILRLRPRITSLDDSPGEGTRSVHELLTDERLSDPSQEVLDREAQGRALAAVDRLSPVERRVIRARFGLRGKSAKSLREIGEQLGISRERVRQIEVQAKERLRRMFAS